MNKVLYSRVWTLSKLMYKNQILSVLDECSYKLKSKSYFYKYFDEKNQVYQKVCYLIVDDIMYIAFCGTDLDLDIKGLNDWINNFRLCPTPYTLGCQKGKVHAGFFDSLKACLPDNENNFLNKILNELNNFQGNIYVTGHSKGGALALLFTDILKEAFKERNINLPLHIITFGSPKIGNDDFIKYFQKKLEDNVSYTRFINRKDLSADFPPHFLGYEHTGKLYTLWTRQKRYPYLKKNERTSPSLLYKYYLFFTKFKKTHFDVYNSLYDKDDLLSRILTGHDSVKKFK